MEPFLDARLMERLSQDRHDRIRRIASGICLGSDTASGASDRDICAFCKTETPVHEGYLAPHHGSPDDPANHLYDSEGCILPPFFGSEPVQNVLAYVPSKKIFAEEYYMNTENTSEETTPSSLEEADSPVQEKDPTPKVKMMKAGCGHLIPARRGRPPKLCPECKAKLAAEKKAG